MKYNKIGSPVSQLPNCEIVNQKNKKIDKKLIRTLI